ncbi:hypothetical protein ABB37_01358 [Leptomonas pyrrhocoris]|uniref:Uncharacterized protein n=1 Tax=Leptomonas pyrrhocoris TaxID=157538 RepID=A0A0M9G8V4_LEPPY|nr:hypothetical protein ABB37_01358 [Leptomonas pyrrhocoris]KPA84906.1 hypothetical protein ABB37_01358 [Leptomonas pyrrhocoris]|eukprot:XP_015663345.1 hypothetical protein ABB37_01358 [Leptomonas pyrrhocoris]
MSPSVVCVLHSANECYAESLVGNALQCLHAIQRSVRVTAPDFIPSIAVFFADPQNGARCVYSSVVPDRNHALDGVAATYPPLADANGVPFSHDNGAEANQTEKPTAFVQLFRLRSPLFLQQTVLQAVRKQNTSVSTSASVGASTSASPAPTARDSDIWGSLTGALLASLCYLRAHPSSAFTSVGMDDMDSVADDATDDAAGGTPDEGAHPSRGTSRILIFSDARAGAAPSYSAECGLAMAVVTASKMGVVVSCFGDAVAQTDSAENRLVGLASSLGGFCAARFTLADLGQLLDGESGLTEGSGGSSSRRKRDRIASQFVVGPTMLPCHPLPTSTLENTSLDIPIETEKKEAVAVDGTSSRERASHLGWLCPSCMAIIHRSPREVPESSSGVTNQRAEDGSGEPQSAGVRCPYCHAV